jgi:predicted signal transduction protein with EAL and GGDEF domain
MLLSNVPPNQHSLNLTAVAEGIESPEHLRQLEDFGGDIAQGFHFGRPVPPENVPLWSQTGPGPVSQPLPIRRKPALKSGASAPTRRDGPQGGAWAGVQNWSARRPARLHDR